MIEPTWQDLKTDDDLRREERVKAAAPELLAFAERFIEWACSEDVSVWVIPSLARDALTAIWKAKGNV